MTAPYRDLVIQSDLRFILIVLLTLALDSQLLLRPQLFTGNNY